MAETYKNARLAITNSEQTLYTCSASGAIGVLVNLRVTNIDGSNDDTVTVVVRDSSASVDTQIASTITVPADSAIDIVGDGAKMFLENGDSVKITGGNASGDLIAFASVLEIT
tara:strand:- start:74 stop:412 length:339 start_codon:yes stop_codon:yes gene_type:complete